MTLARRIAARHLGCYLIPEDMWRQIQPRLKPGYKVARSPDALKVSTSHGDFTIFQNPQEAYIVWENQTFWTPEDFGKEFWT